MKYKNMESIKLHIAKQSEDFKKELNEVKKKYPLFYLAYLTQEAMIAELSVETYTSLAFARLDKDVATKIRVNYSNCKRNFERAIGSVTNDEEAASAFDGYFECLRNVTR